MSRQDTRGFCGAIAAAGKNGKVRATRRGRRCDFTGAEPRMIDYVFDEGNIRFHAANPEFAEGAVHGAGASGRFAPQAVT